MGPSPLPSRKVEIIVKDYGARAEDGAFADRDVYYADPLFEDVPLRALLSPKYAALRRGLIDPKQASLVQRPVDPRLRGLLVFEG